MKKYECALLRNRVNGTRVLPIFVGEEKTEEEKEKARIEKAKQEKARQEKAKIDQGTSEDKTKEEKEKEKEKERVEEAVEYTRLSLGVATSGFPDEVHKRGPDAVKLLERLG